MATSTIKGESRNLSSYVDISSYTTNPYTFPSDGYLLASCAATSNAKAIVEVYGADGNTSNSFRMGGWSNGAYGTWACLVKEGMKAKVITLENSGRVMFLPYKKT